jgi:hypothetical protein
VGWHRNLRTSTHINDFALFRRSAPRRLTHDIADSRARSPASAIRWTDASGETVE